MGRKSKVQDDDEDIVEESSEKIIKKVVDKVAEETVDEVIDAVTSNEDIEMEEAKRAEQKRRKALRNEITHKLRFDILERDEYRCNYCGASPRINPDVSLVVDHVIPLDKGGDNSLTNLVTSCYSCNEGKKDRLLMLNTFERDYDLPIDKILEISSQGKEGAMNFLISPDNEESRLYLYDLHRQAQDEKCVNDCNACISAGKSLYLQCMGSLYEKAKFGVDNKRFTSETSLAVIDDSVGVVSGKENIIIAPENTLQCDVCYVNRRCTKYRVGGYCFYDFSAKTDFTNAPEAFKILLQVQAKRVLTGAFFETVDGGVLDKNLSNEISLMTSMVKTFKDLESNRASFSIQASGEGAGGVSVIGQLFEKILNKPDKEVKKKEDFDEAEIIE